LIGEEKTYRARGIHEFPIENTIHLRLKDPDGMDKPMYFNQFQEDDISELTASGKFGLTDTAIKSIGHLRTLTKLRVGSNDVSDESIQYINQLPLLQTLYIAFTGITENGACSLKRLKNFTDFGVGRMDSASRLLSILKNSNNLHAFGVVECNLTKEDLKKIGTMQKLDSLNVSENKNVDDDSLKLLVPLKNLRKLNIKHTEVTPASLETFKLFSKLSVVIIGVNQWPAPDVYRFKTTYPKIVLDEETTDVDVVRDAG
jgi:Leucine-rich repeat (LRR) protein